MHSEKLCSHSKGDFETRGQSSRCQALCKSSNTSSFLDSWNDNNIGKSPATGSDSYFSSIPTMLLLCHSIIASDLECPFILAMHPLFLESSFPRLDGAEGHSPYQVSEGSKPSRAISGNLDEASSSRKPRHDAKAL